MGILSQKPNQQPPASGPEASAGAAPQQPDPSSPPAGENLPGDPNETQTGEQVPPAGTDGSDSSGPAPSAEPALADPKNAAAKAASTKAKPEVRIYRVNWEFSGFREQPLKEGDLVEATEDEAAPYVGRGGVLTPAEEEA